MPAILNDISTASVTSEVLLDGQKLTGANGIVSVVVEKIFNKIASAQVILIDGSSEAADFTASNQAYTLPGKTLEIKCGYNDDNQTLFKGIVVSHSIKVRSGKSQLILNAKDKSVSMALTKKNNYFLTTTDSDIITQIISDEGYIPEVDTTTTIHDQIVQSQCSAWDFIVQRAEANGMLVSTDDGKISVKKPSLLNVSLITASYGKNIYEFDAEMDARHQASKITSKGWKHDDLSLLSEDSNEPSLAQQGNVDASQLADDIKSGDYIQLHGGIHNENELTDWSNALILKNRLAKTIGRVKISGTPVDLGQLITLEGLGDRFNGQVLVTGVRHEIVRGGWWIDIQFGLAPKWHSQEYDTSYNEVSNLLPSIHGLHIGVVTALEGDPESNERIKIKLPFVKDSEEGIWARVATVDAGTNRGTVILPEIGDEVIVGFIQEDPRFAIVLGMLHSKKNTRPTDLQAKDDNHIKGWVTRSEMKMLFDDDKKIFSLLTPGGYSLIIDEDAKKIEIKDANSNQITMSDSGIEINSYKDLILKATNDVKIQGVNIKEEASAEWSANGSAGSKVESSATTTIKGSMVMIN